MCSAEDENINKEINFFDLNVFANTICNTDNLIKQMRIIANENEQLKKKLKCVNDTTIEMKILYDYNNKKIKNLEEELTSLKVELKDSNVKKNSLEHDNINLSQLQKQTMANLIELEEREKAFPICNQIKIYKLLSVLGKVLQDNGLLVHHLRKQYKSVIEILPVKEIDISWLNSKRLNKIEKTLSAIVKKEKTYCDQATCYSASNVTRATCTSAFIKKIDVGTCFPEYIPKSIESIFEDTITDMPRLITPIVELNQITTDCETQTNFISTTKDCGTITNIRNVRKKIVYYGRSIKHTISSTCIHNLKEERPSTLDCNRWARRNLSSIWRILGEAIFAIVGNERTFEHSVSSNVLNKLLELVGAIEHEAGTDEDSMECNHKISDILNEALFRRKELKKSENVKKEIPESESISEEIVQNNIEIQTQVEIIPDTEKTLEVPVEHNTASPESVSISKEIVQNNIEVQTQVEIITDTEKTSEVPVEHNIASQSLEFFGFEDNELNSTELYPVIRSESPDFLGFDLELEKNSSPVIQIQHKKRKKKEIISSRRSKRLALRKNEENINLVENYGILISPQSHNTNNTKEYKEIQPSIHHILKYFRVPRIITPIEDVEKQNNFYDSPQSPIECTIDDEELIKYTIPLIPLERFEFHNVTYSPEEPPIDSNITNCTPIMIPLERRITDQLKYSQYTSSAIGKIISMYDNKRREKIVKNTKLHIQSIQESQLIDRLRRIITHYINIDWNSINLKKCYLKILKYAKRPKIIITCIIEITESSSDEQISMKFTPPAPPIPKTHKKLLILIRKLTENIKGFEKMFLFCLERKLFNFKSKDIELSKLMSLTNLYIGLIDMNINNSWKSRMFMYKSLYYFGFKSIPMIYYIFLAFPSVIPKNFSPTQEMKTDPIINTILHILMNIQIKLTDSQANNNFHKNDLVTLLTKNYGYQRGNFSIDELIKNLIEKLNSNDIKNISYSFILLAKRNGYEWSLQNIIQKHMLPMLKLFLQNITLTDENDKKIIACVNIISSILKTTINCEDITEYIQIMYTLFQSTDKKIIQEAAVMALLRLGRFGVVDIYQRLLQWNPSYKLSRKVLIMLKSFVHRKPQNFWTSRMTR